MATRIRLILCLVLLSVAACGRVLSPGETAFAATLFGPKLRTDKVRVAPFNALSNLSQQRPPRPQVACRERIWPAPKTSAGMVETFTAAFVTFQRLNIADDLYLLDYMAKYPDKMSLPAAMFIGHELTHVWQWQNRQRTGYHPLRAAAEHKPGKDPYLLELDVQADFLDFPFEQQGAIVEEYICCRHLDPTGGRTQRLHRMLSAAMPVAALNSLPQTDVILPWSGAKIVGICR